MSNHNYSWETIKDRQVFSANSFLRLSTWAFSFTNQIGYYRHAHKGFIEPIKQLKLYSWGFLKHVCLNTLLEIEKLGQTQMDLGLLLNLLKIITDPLATSYSLVFLPQDTAVVIFLLLMFLHLGSALLSAGAQAQLHFWGRWLNS